MQTLLNRHYDTHLRLGEEEGYGGHSDTDLRLGEEEGYGGLYIRSIFSDVGIVVCADTIPNWLSLL